MGPRVPGPPRIYSLKLLCKNAQPPENIPLLNFQPSPLFQGVLPCLSTFVALACIFKLAWFKLGTRLETIIVVSNSSLFITLFSNNID